MIQQYYRLKKSKKKLVDQISNTWLLPFFAIEAGVGVLIALALGFTLEELSAVTNDTENGVLLGVLTIMAVPFSAWLAWGLSALPFLVLGRLDLNELKSIMLRFRYPEYWLGHNL